MAAHTYIMTKMQGKVFSFLQNEKRSIEIHCDQEQSDLSLGTIYIGRIQKIAKNINAAFVEISPGKNCYLPLEDMQNPIYTKKGTSKLPQQGDELLVQISREGIKTKLPSVTTNLTLHGKYVLLTTGNTQISISSKLSKPVREQLLQYAQEEEKRILHLSPDSDDAAAQDAVSPRSFGWLMRTNAGTAEEQLLSKDMERLYLQYQTLIQQAKFRTCYSCMLQTPASYLTRLSNLYDHQVERIITDDEALYAEIKAYLEHVQPEDQKKLSLYQDELLPLKKLYSLEKQLQEALGERVWLKCGGYLIIQPTEALTVIDVNSGKSDGGKKKEEAILKVNLEAAKEIAHQLRMRNISGIVLVDFINMKLPESNQQLLAALEQYLKLDPVKTVLVDMTRLSLVEITRMKKEKPLHEAVKANSDRTH